jgi:hypothetical protein
VESDSERWLALSNLYAARSVRAKRVKAKASLAHYQIEKPRQGTVIQRNGIWIGIDGEISDENNALQQDVYPQMYPLGVSKEMMRVGPL